MSEPLKSGLPQACSVCGSPGHLAPFCPSAELVRVRADLEAVRMQLGHYFDNLTSTQEMATRQLLELRELRPLKPLLDGLTAARLKHPEGAHFAALAEEVGEVARAARRETPWRVREELIDVATVAMRLYFGERTREP